MFKRLLIVSLLSLCVILPTVAAAQDTPTPEPTATLAPVATPVVIVTPSPVDTAAIPSWVFFVVIAAILGMVTVAGVGIVEFGKKIPDGGRAILTSALNSGIDQLDLYAKGTATPLDDAIVAELRSRILELEKQMNAVPGQTAQAIHNNNAVQMQNVQKLVSGQPTTPAGGG